LGKKFIFKIYNAELYIFVN